MKKNKTIMTLGLLVTSLVFASPILWAREHPSSTEHPSSGHSGTAMEGSHKEGSHGAMMQSDADVLNEAAGVLKSSHPELAAKLEAIAKKHE